MKKDRKPRNDKGIEREKRIIKKVKYKLQLNLYGKIFNFRKLTDVKKYFDNVKNTEEDEILNNIIINDNIKYILTNTYLLRRLCNIIRGYDEPSLKKTETRQKYLSDKNLRITPLF